MCRLHWQHSTIVLLISCNVFCSGTLAALQEGLELTRHSSIWLVIWTETNDTLKSPLLTPARFQAGFLLFLFVCLFMYLKEKGISVLMKSQYPAGLRRDCNDAGRHRAFPSPHQGTPSSPDNSSLFLSCAPPPPSSD